MEGMLKSRQGYLDIVQTLQSRDGRLWLGTGLINKLFRKWLILLEGLRGRASLREVFWNLLPESQRLQDVRDLDADILFRYLFRGRPHEPLNLLGFQLYYRTSEDLSLQQQYLCLFGTVAMIKEIILADQYSAREFLRHDSVVIDAGANLGIFSLLATALVPKGKVYAFEPSTLTFNLLEKNINSNGLASRVHIFREGLADETTYKKLMVSKGVLQTDNIMADSDFIRGKEDQFVEEQEVRVTRIDDLVQQYSLPRVDFIKIDTEGYETRILKGASKTIKTFSPTIACSAYHLASDKTELPKLVLSINPSYRHRIDKKNEEDLIFWVDKCS